MEIIVYLPVDTRLVADKNTRSFHRNESRYRDILDVGDEGKILKITPTGTLCLDCDTPPRKTKTNTTSKKETTTFENWEEDVNNSLNINTKKVKEVKVKVNDSLKIKQTTITESF